MPTPTDAVITVLIVAIVANLAIMGLLVLNLWVRRRSAPPESAAALAAQPGATKGGEMGQMPDATRLERAIAGDRAEAYGAAAPVVPTGGAAAMPSPEAAPAPEAPVPVAAEPAPAPSAAAAPTPPGGPMVPPPAPVAEDTAMAADAPGFELEPPTDLLLDPVTGLESAYAWERHLREEASRLRRYGRPFAIVYAELDGLDRLADRVGADAAGRIVPAIGQVLQRQARAVDIVARVGPTRFAVLLPETDEVRAINYVERVRSACDVWLQAGAVALQLSFGWASPGPEGDTHTAQLRADERLQGELAVTRRRMGAS
ncbi:MAG: GGDEF domain-containing protein [Candidatus Limnocylindrales bacterium]